MTTERTSIRPIRNDADHRRALQRIERLMAATTRARAGSAEADELEVLATLVSAYEDEHHAIDAPDPAEAIRFRMEQAGLRQKDLVPFIGTASRVSEVLKGKRPLTVDMIRRLHEGLGIPLRSLLGIRRGSWTRDAAASASGIASVVAPEELIELAKHAPVGEMAKRGWFDGFKGTPAKARRRSIELLAAFFADARGAGSPCFLRSAGGQARNPTAATLSVWHRQVVRVADRVRLGEFDPASITSAFARRVAGLSDLPDGPNLAAEVLGRHGIALVVVQHLPGSRIDGAATRRTDGRPVIALTLRHRRVDHFWFTLLHELGHVAMHLDASGGKDGPAPILDEFGTEGGREGRRDGSTDAKTARREREADEFAQAALIPDGDWRAARLARLSELRGDAAVAAVHALARKVGVHPAVVAGRVRKESGDFRRLSALVAETVELG